MTPRIITSEMRLLAVLTQTSGVVEPADRERDTDRLNQADHGLKGAGRQPVVPQQERLGDLRRGEEHPRQRHAIDHGSQIDCLDGAQHGGGGAAIAHLDELGVGDHPGSTPGAGQDETDEQERQGEDPQLPQSEDAGGGQQARDEERPAGEEILLEVLGRLPAVSEAGVDGVGDEGYDDQRVDRRHASRPSGRRRLSQMMSMANE